MYPTYCAGWGQCTYDIYMIEVCECRYLYVVYVCCLSLLIYIYVCGYFCVSILLSLINFHSSLPASLPTILPLLEFVYAYSIFIVLTHTHKRVHAGIRVLVWVRGRGRKGEGGSGDHAGRCTHLPSRPSSQSIKRRGGFRAFGASWPTSF